MSLQHWLLLVLIPLMLGVVVFAFRNNLRAQLVSILMGGAINAILVVALEVLPEGGFTQHGNTWQGYALIGLGPYLVVLVVVATLRSLRLLRPVDIPVVVAVSVPLSYWVGLLIAVAVAVTAGLATP
jgi:hypothetical protein